MSQQTNDYYQKIQAQMKDGSLASLQSNNQGIIGDVVDTFQHGVYKGVAGVGESLGLEEMRDWAQEGAQENRDSLSVEAKQSLNKEFVSEDAQGNLIAGEGLTDWRTWLLTTSDMLGMNADLIIGGGALKAGTLALTKIAKFARSKALKNGAPADIAEELAQKATKSYAQKHGKLKELSGDVAAYGGAAHLQYGGMQAIDMREEVEAMDFEDLADNEIFVTRARELKRLNPTASQYDILKTAQSEMAEQAANAVLQNPALITSNVLMGGLGGKMLEGLLRGGGNTLAKVTGEGITEGVQGTTEQYVSNIVGQEYVDENIEATQGLLKSGLNEAIAGTGSAAGFAGAGKLREKIFGLGTQSNYDDMLQRSGHAEEFENLSKEKAEAVSADVAQEKDTSKQEWSEYNDERYKAKQGVNKETGEVIDELVPFVMRKDGGHFTSKESANNAAKHLGVKDKYEVIETNEGAVLRLKPEFANGAMKAINDTEGNYQENGTELITKVMASAEEVKAKGEFFNHNQYGELLKAIAENKPQEDITKLATTVFVDPTKAYMKREQAALETKRAEDKAQDDYLERVQLGNQRFWENNSRADIEVEERIDTDAVLNAQDDAALAEQLEVDRNRRIDEDTYYGDRDQNNAVDSVQKNEDYDRALAEKSRIENNETKVADFNYQHTKEQEKESSPLFVSGDDISKNEQSRTQQPTLLMLRQDLKNKRKKFAKKLKQQGVSQSLRDKVLAAIVAQNETDLAAVEATSDFSEQANYQPNHLLAESLLQFKPVKKALAKLPETEQTQVKNDLTQSLSDIAEAVEPVVSSEAAFDEAANTAATSPKNDLTEPTQGQKEANNYKLGRGKHSGFDIGIENPQGSYRKGEDKEGNKWSNKINHHYGDITGTKGADGDALDVFVNPNTETSESVYVIDQVDPTTKAFDEHKIMLGFDSKALAKKAYLSNYDKNWQGVGEITSVDLQSFSNWVKNADTTEPFSDSQKQASIRSKNTTTLKTDNMLEVGADTGEPSVSLDNKNIIPKQSTDNVDKSSPTATLGGELTVEDYKRSVLVKGKTKKHKEQLKNAKGIFNRTLDGWIYPQKRKTEIEQLVAKINDEVSNESSTVDNLESVKPNSATQSTVVTDDGSKSRRASTGRGTVAASGANDAVAERESTGSASVSNDSPSADELTGDKSFYQQAAEDGVKVDIARSSERSGGDLSGRQGDKTGRKRSDAIEAVVVSGSKSTELTAKLTAQNAAVNIPYKENDPQNIRDRLPYLFDAQQDDVIKAEARFFDKNEKGILFTNGTGTGKTLTGGGIIVRAIDRGAKRILVVTKAGMIPSWRKDNKNIGLTFHKLKTKADGGVEDKVNITSYENFGDNPELLKAHWDLVVYDESHKIQENMQGKGTNATGSHYRLTNPTNVDENHFYWRAVEALPELKAERDALWQKAADKFAKGKVKPTDKDLLQAYEFNLTAEANNDIDVLVKEASNEKAFKKLAVALKAKEKANPTKVTFLSASPFGVVKNIFYADGYLFDSKKGASDSQSYNTGNNQEQYLGNFGYSMKYNKANRPSAEVDSGMLEREWMDSLLESGAASYRGLDVAADYSREFVKVNSTIGEKLDYGYGILNDSDNNFGALRTLLYNKMKGGKDRELLEALRARESINRIKKHLKLGRKVVVFHERQQLNVPNPFKFERAELAQAQVGYGETESAAQQYERFKAEYPALVNLDLTRLLAVPQQIAKHFDAENVAYFSGQNTKDRESELAKFNDDKGDKQILVIQKQSGKEGLSAHDKTGNFQRVLMIMNTPVSPSDAIQMEGRTYRYMVQTDAIVEYPVIGNNFEAMSYRHVVAGRTSTAENLARGNGARDMKGAFKEGYLDPTEEAPHTGQGKGGKVADHLENDTGAFTKAKTYYWKRAKKNSKNKAAEGKDYFSTPEPLGQKMVEWLDLKGGDTALEPSAGHGAISRWFPETTSNIVIEPSQALVGELGMVSDGKVLNQKFEDFYIGNKAHGVAMNPPFGKGGSDAIPHLVKAFDHLKDGGRVVALIPLGSASDKFVKWYSNSKGAYMVGEIMLPSSTFKRAGTGVMTRIVVIDKDLRGNSVKTNAKVKVDLSKETDVNGLFERIEHLEMPPRPDVNVTAEEAGFRQVVSRDDKKDIDVYHVTESYGGASTWVHGRVMNKLADKHNGERKKNNWGDNDGYTFESEKDVNRFYEAMVDAMAKEKARGKGIDLVDNDTEFANTTANDPITIKNPATKALVEEKLNVFLAKYKGLSNIRSVEIYESPSDYYSAEELAENPKYARKAGSYNTGTDTLRVFAKNIPSDDIENTLRHELFIHKGLGIFKQKDLAELLDRIGETRQSNDPLLKQIWQHVDKYYASKSDTVKVEEVLANIAGLTRTHGGKASINHRFRRALDKVGLWLHNFFKKIGWIKSERVPKKSELVDLVLYMADAFERGETPSTRPPSNTKKSHEADDSNEYDNIPFAALSQSAFEAIGKQSPSTTLTALKNVLGNKLSDTRKHWLGALPRRYLADIAGNLIPSIKTYMRQAAQLDADRTDLLTHSAEVVDAWRDANGKTPKMAQALADLMHDATQAGVDPSKAYEALRDLAGFTPDQKRDNDSDMFGEVLTAELVKERIKVIQAQIRGRSGENTAKFMQRIDELKTRWEFEQNRAKAYPDLAAKFAKLPPEMQAMFSKVSEHYAFHRKEEMKALLQRIEELKVNDKQKAALRDQIRLQFESNKVEFYFPLQRFGEYFVRITDGQPDEDGNEETIAFEMFETEFAQQKFIAEQQKEYPPSQIKSGKNLQDAAALDQVSGGFVTDVVALLEPMGSAGNEIADQVYQMYLKRLPALSGRKRKIHRKGVAGFHDDALRGFAHNMFHSAYQISKLRHSEAMQTSLEHMEHEANALDGKEHNKAKDLVGEMLKRHDWIMNPKGGALANKLTSIGFAWYLGVTPAAAMTNLTQTPMLALPVIGSRYGFTKTAGALMHYSKMFVKGGHVEKHLTGDELKAFEAFKKSGLIDKTQTHDLAGVAEGGLEYNSNWYKVMKGVGYLFHHAERYNREVTSMAAYKVAKEKGEEHDAAVEIATNLTFEAHFDYSNGNKARFMQSDVMKVAFIFRQHSVNMTYRLWRDFHQMFKGETKEVRTQAKRQFAGVIGMTGVFAGTAGMPLYSVFSNMLEILFDDEDEPWEFNTEFRNFLAEHLGVQGGRIATHGLVDYLSGATVSSRVGMNNLWIRDANREMDGKETVLHYAEQSLGAVFGLALSAGRGLDYIQRGQVERGIEAMLPKAAKDALKSYRYANEGVQTLSGNNIIDELNNADIVKQLLGYTPSAVSEQYEKNNAMKGPEIKLKRRRSLLMNRWALAMRLRDRDFIKETQADINIFNGKNPTLAINEKSKLLSLKARKRNRAKSVEGVIIDKRLESLREVVQF